MRKCEYNFRFQFILVENVCRRRMIAFYSLNLRYSPSVIRHQAYETFYEYLKILPCVGEQCFYPRFLVFAFITSSPLRMPPRRKHSRENSEINVGNHIQNSVDQAHAMSYTWNEFTSLFIIRWALAVILIKLFLLFLSIIYLMARIIKGWIVCACVAYVHIAFILIFIFMFMFDSFLCCGEHHINGTRVRRQQVWFTRSVRTHTQHRK